MTSKTKTRSVEPIGPEIRSGREQIGLLVIYVPSPHAAPQGLPQPRAAAACPLDSPAGASRRGLYAPVAHDLDTYRAAKLLIDQHGADAEIRAAWRADILVVDGDVEGSASWRRILTVI